MQASLSAGREGDKALDIHKKVNVLLKQWLWKIISPVAVTILCTLNI